MFNKFFLLNIFICFISIIVGCSTYSHNNPVDKKSNPQSYDYKNVNATPYELNSTFLRNVKNKNINKLSKINLGLNQNDVFFFLGDPDSKNNKNEWEYLFDIKIKNTDDYIVCQFKITFDKKDKTITDTTWRRSVCNDLYSKEFLNKKS